MANRNEKKDISGNAIRLSSSVNLSKVTLLRPDFSHAYFEFITLHLRLGVNELLAIFLLFSIASTHVFVFVEDFYGLRMNYVSSLTFHKNVSVVISVSLAFTMQNHYVSDQTDVFINYNMYVKTLNRP